MAQPSSLFVGRDILQTILGTFFLGHPVQTPETLKILNFFMVTFPIYQFSNILSQNIEKKFWGYPPFGPLKIIAYEK